MKRHDPGVQYAAESVRRIGPVLSANVWYRVMSALRAPDEATLFPVMIVDEDVRSHESTYKADRQSYLLTTHGAHMLDGLCYLLGEPTALSAHTARIGKDLSWHGVAELTGGGLSHFEITANVHAEWSEGADIYGERGYVKLRTHFPFALCASEVEVFDETTLLSKRPVFGHVNAYQRQVEAFAHAIRTGAKPTPDAHDGIAALKLIDAIARSAANDGAQVTL